ncbi:ketohexokinase [Drosophila innubila]|uniref:ketohexokinase n=1 Tax=Drosophila innubila TaxID=198719 RepID=UPI00148CB5AB|nr:ketohexokinase [Drosophila innubila]
MDRSDNRLSWAAGKKKVLCVGGAVIDCISIVRKFPKVMMPERSIKGFWQKGGHAVNTATVLKNLGINVELFVLLSNNPMFRLLLDDMRFRGIEIDNCPRCEDTPPFSSVILSKLSKTCTITNCTSSFPYVTLEDFQKLDLSKYGWIHFRGSKPEVTVEMMKLVVAYNENHEEKILISMDVNTELNSIWPLTNYCDYVFFSKQLGFEHGWQTPREACRSIDEKLRLRFGINLKRPFVVFLWGKRGAGLLDYNSNYSRSHAVKNRRVVESLGAGEAFVGAFIYAVYVRDRTNSAAADFANRMASHKCTKYGYDHMSDILVAPVL